MELQDMRRDDSVNNWLKTSSLGEVRDQNRPPPRSSQRNSGERSSYWRNGEERPNEGALNTRKYQDNLLAPEKPSRKPSLKGKPQSLLMNWSKKTHAKKMADKSPEDKIMEALQAEISPRDIPERLSSKRKILKSISVDPTMRMTYRTNAKKLGFFSLAKYQMASWLDKVKRGIAEISPELWGASIKSIEGQFGSGVGSYFKLLRLLLQANLSVVIVSWLFLISPQMYVGNDHQNNNATTFQPEDILTLEGWFEDNLFLFYKNYGNGIMNTYWPNYNMTQGYFYTILFCVIIYLIFVLASFLHSYKMTLRNGGQTTGKTYSKCVFTKWEMNVTDEKAAQSLRSKITEDFTELLKKSENSRKRKIPIEKKVIRFLLFVFSLAIVSGILVAIWYLLESESDPQKQDDTGLLAFWHKIAVSVVLAGVFLVVPTVFDLFARIEEYNVQVKLYLGLFRNVLLTIGPIVMIIFVLYIKDRSSDNIHCPETDFGQEIYKLLLWSYLIGIILINSITETIRNIVFRMGFKFFGAPQFDTGRNTMFLIYGQFLAWVGFYFSPMLPLVMTVLLFLSFYIKQLSLYYNCSLSPKTWEGSASKTVFYALTLLLFITSLMFFIWVINEQPQDDTCGPFPGMKPYDQWPLHSILEILTVPVIGFVDLVLLVIGFYVLSLANARRKRGKELRKQNKIEMEDLKFLRQELSAFYKSDGILRT